MTALASPHTNRDQWLRERRRGIGASESPVILGLTGSRLELWLEKRGEAPPREQTERMLVGLELEPYMVRLYEQRTGFRIVETQRCAEHPDMPWMLATIDGIREDGRIVEFKVVGDYSPIDRQLGEDGDTESLPNTWAVQHTQQLEIARASGISDGEEGDIAVLGPTIHRFRVYPLRRSDELFGIISPAVSNFWHHHVVEDVPPGDIVAADAATLAKVYRAQTGEWLELGDDVLDAARRYHEMGRIAREAEKDREIERARLLMALGNADGATLPGGWRVSRKVVPVNHKPQEAYVSTQVRLTVKEPR